MMCWSGKNIVGVLEWENIVDVLEWENIVDVLEREKHRWCAGVGNCRWHSRWGYTGVLSREPGCAVVGCAVVGCDIIGWSGKLCVVLLMCCSGKC
ncbi:hypothetical protein FV297_05360 [Escherichia coli]|uniref:hypothetical protein n=1 Tax=Escherichia coli TaxID=562 RepID=UPI0011C79052|nr:hypothetical protein [Escherichia coli]TXQ48904.1 hypothetical protein FV297_05360 [Escherichia coli]